MLLRLFDREDLQLIPSIEFAAPLPELEALRRGDAKAADGIEWIGAGGDRLAADLRPARRIGPVLQHLGPARAGGDAPRRAGVRRSLRPAPFACRAGPAAVRPGLCPVARARLGNGRRHDRPLPTRRRGCKCPARGRTASPPAPPSSTATSIAPQWLQWRADQLHQFYRRVQQTLAAGHSGATLCLAGAEMFSGPEIEAQLRPSSRRGARWSNRCSTRALTCGNTRTTARSSCCGRNASPRSRGSAPRRSIWKSTRCPTSTKASATCLARAASSSTVPRKPASPPPTRRARSSRRTPGC